MQKEKWKRSTTKAESNEDKIEQQREEIAETKKQKSKITGRSWKGSLLTTKEEAPLHNGNTKTSTLEKNMGGGGKGGKIRREVLGKNAFTVREIKGTKI